MNDIPIDEQLQRDRKREEKTALDLLQKSDEELLKEIFFCSSDLLSHGPTTNISRTIAHFSALLVKLSRQAEESTKQTIKLTKQLYYLTWFIAILTAILLLLGFFEFPKKSIFGNQKINQTSQYTHQNQPNKINGNHK